MSYLDFIPDNKSKLTTGAYEELALEALLRAKKMEYRDGGKRDDLLATAQVFASLAVAARTRV